MPVGNAWKHAPARQARLQQDMRDPEWCRRREVYRTAKGPLAKGRVADWNVAWNNAGRPGRDSFPDFEEWAAANPNTYQPYHKKLNPIQQ